jgi:hypothetical protein
VRELGAERDTLIASSYAEEVVPEALDGHTGEERTRVYRMLQLEVRPEGYEVSEALCNRRQKGRSRSQSTKPTELRFCALLREGRSNIPQGYLSQILTPFNLTVTNMLDISARGVEYAIAGATIGA